MSDKEIKKLLKRYIFKGEAVIKYSDEFGRVNYFIVEKMENERVYGQISSPLGVNSISLDDLMKKKIKIAEFKKLEDLEQ